MKVQWTVPAVDDFESIRDYIARDSDLYAASFIEKYWIQERKSPVLSPARQQINRYCFF